MGRPWEPLAKVPVEALLHREDCILVLPEMLGCEARLFDPVCLVSLLPVHERLVWLCPICLAGVAKRVCRAFETWSSAEVGRMC